MQPEVMLSSGTLTLSAESRECSNVLSITPSTLTWNRTQDPSQQIVTLSTTTREALACQFTISQSGTTTYEANAVDARIQLLAAPRISMLASVDGDVVSSLKAEEMRTKKVVLKVTLSSGTFRADLTASATRDETGVRINLTVAGTPASTSPGSSITTEINPQRTVIEISIPPVANFMTYVQQMLFVCLSPSALDNGVIPSEDGNTTNITIMPVDRVAIAPVGERQALETVTFGASSVSGLTSLAAASQAGKVLTIAGTLECPSEKWIEDQDDLPFYVCLIPFALGSKPNLGWYAGAVVSNLMVISGVGIIHFTLCVLLRKMRGSGFDFDRARAALQFPGLLWFPLLLMFQTTMISAMRLLLYSPATLARLLGTLVLLAGFLGTPGILIRLLSRARALTYKRPRPHWAVEVADGARHLLAPDRSYVG